VRLLFVGDLAHTGFGTVTRDLGRALLERGVDVRYLSQNDMPELPEEYASRALEMAFFTYGRAGVLDVRAFVPGAVLGTLAPWLVHAPACPGAAGGPEELDSCECEPTLQEHALANGEPWGDWRPDVVLLLGDYYAIRDLIATVGLATFRQVPTLHYVPIEGHDLPPKWREVWDVVKPVAMSRFGQGEIERVMGEAPPLAYHGVDTAAFRPITPSEPLELTVELDGELKTSVLRSKAGCKVWWGLPPASTLLLRTDRNMPRKGYPALIRALAPVLAERPALYLALHCRSRDQGGDLWDSISKLPPEIAARILVPDWGALPREALVVLLNAADLYVSTSAEGFGLTIAEAIACGVPAVALDYSAVPEVVGPAGALTTSTGIIGPSPTRPSLAVASRTSSTARTSAPPSAPSAPPTCGATSCGATPPTCSSRPPRPPSLSPRPRPRRPSHDL
jgi:glycosyltransferase involved in cell wall biosynthesis